MCFFNVAKICHFHLSSKLKIDAKIPIKILCFVMPQMKKSHILHEYSYDKKSHSNIRSTNAVASGAPSASYWAPNNPWYFLIGCTADPLLEYSSIS